MNENEIFNVNLDVFEGPFDLLLSLVIRQEVDICEVPIASIIADYIEYAEAKHDYDIELTSEFLILASTLLEIKSNVLFPLIFGYEDDGELTPEEAQKMLAYRLIEYKKFKGASAFLFDRLISEDGIYYRFPISDSIIRKKKLPEGSHSPMELTSFLSSLLRIAPSVKIDVSHILNVAVSVEEQIERIMGVLHSEGVMTFKELTKEMSGLEKAISFFAILELYKNEILDLRQDVLFGPIQMSLREGTRDKGEGIRGKG